MFGVHTHKKTTDAVARHSAKWLQSKNAVWALAVLSFAESLFAPVIIDPFLVALIMGSPKKWKMFIIISIIASTIGGICAYALGFLFFDTFGAKLVSIYSLEGTFEHLSSGLSDSGFVFVLVGAFTPIPYKLVAIASGLLHIGFLTFLVASVFGRTLRLGLVGFATHAVGPKALPLVRKNLFVLATATGVLLLIYLSVQLL